MAILGLLVTIGFGSCNTLLSGTKRANIKHGRKSQDRCLKCSLSLSSHPNPGHLIRHRVHTSHVLGRDYIFLPTGFVNAAVDDDNVEQVMLLQNCDVLQGLPVHHNTVGVVSFFNLAHLVGTHEQLCNPIRCRDDGLMGCESKALHEVGEITGIGTMWCPSKAIVSTRVLDKSNDGYIIDK